MAARRAHDFRSLPTLLLAAAALAGSACTAPPPAPDFNSFDSRARIRAIQHAAATDDRSSIPLLIDRLDSDDAAERLLAFRTLERMTGQTHGYDYAASPAERDQAVQRWIAWYRRSSAGA